MTTSDRPPERARYRVSRRRQMRKWLVATFGRRRRPGTGRQNVAPRYTRPEAVERFYMYQLSLAGRSAREIGRLLGRDHHTVMRHSAATRAFELASALVLESHFAEARLVLARVADRPRAAAVRTQIGELRRLAPATRRVLRRTPQRHVSALAVDTPAATPSSSASNGQSGVPEGRRRMKNTDPSRTRRPA
jgi:hypothetical protein